jgi:hypothetical protein
VGGGLTVLSNGAVRIEQQLGDAELEALAEHHDARVVILHQLTLPDLAFLEPLTSLEAVQLLAVRAADYSALARLKTLRKLFINGAKEASLSYLSDCVQLEDLSILYARQLTALPNLSRCSKLSRLMLWDCKRLTSVTPLLAIPNLATIQIVDIGLKDPGAYEPLIAAPQTRYVAVQLSGKRRNAEIDRLLTMHAKSRDPPAA